MVSYKSLSIVPVVDIPKHVVDCPTTDLLDLYKLCLHMEKICLDSEGIGLSAVQVGVPWKLFVVKYPTDDSHGHFFRYFVNCEYTPIAEEKEKSLEGCLSLRKPDGQLRYFEVERFKKIKLVGQELKTDPSLKLVDLDKDIEPDDYYRIVYQHEVQHHHGILISEIGKELEIWKN